MHNLHNKFLLHFQKQQELSQILTVKREIWYYTLVQHFHINFAYFNIHAPSSPKEIGYLSIASKGSAWRFPKILQQFEMTQPRRSKR